LGNGVCPFRRLDDISTNGPELIRQIRSIYANYPDIETQIIVASVRHHLASSNPDDGGNRDHPACHHRADGETSADR
jgi:hypothetical protein